MANLLVSSDTGLLTLAGGAEVISLSFLGLFLFPTCLPEKDLAVMDQYSRGP